MFNTKRIFAFHGKKIISILGTITLGLSMLEVSIGNTEEKDNVIILEESAYAGSFAVTNNLLGKCDVTTEDLNAHVVGESEEVLQEDVQASEETSEEITEDFTSTESTEDTVQETTNATTQEEVVQETSEEEVGEPEVVSEYYDVTEEQLVEYFGYEIDEWELAYWEACTMAECGYNQPDEGIKAVADVIQVRTNSDNYPNTVYGVITQEGQFSTWDNCNVKRYLGNISEQVHKACMETIKDGGTYGYQYFNNKPFKFTKGKAYQIGDHYFYYN